ncbi:hypothetical protein DFH09DRAFT_1090576 [Mycena vulgaris]|nr:hypothetical protein DFH09DRAFT_1090576 [Mycena vulgaris]
MSLHLGPRHQCASRECDCCAFLSEASDGSPLYTVNIPFLIMLYPLITPEDFPSAETTCSACEHSWIAHENDAASVAPENRRFIKGGADHGRCGSFHSSASADALGLLMIVPVSSASGLTRARFPPSQPLPLVPSSPRNARHSLTQESHGGPLQPQFSKKYQSSAGPSSAPANPRSKKRLSGPPRPYSSGPAATLADFSTAPSEPLKVKITVGILPKVLNTSDHNDLLDLSPRYLWKGGDDLELAQRQLQLANLTFTVLVPTSGPVFEAINDEFTAHCLKQNIDFVAPTPASTNGVIYTTPNTLPWILLGPKGRVPNRTWVEDPKCLTPFTFAVPALRASPYSGTSNFIEEGIFIFVAPRLRNLRGPIDCLFGPSTRRPDHVLTHQCFARRVLHPILSSLSDDPSPACGPSCTRISPCTPVDLTDTELSPVQEYINLTRPLRELDSDDSDDDVHVSGDPSTIPPQSYDRSKFPEAERLISQESTPPIPSATTSTPPFIAGPLLVSLMDSAPVSVKLAQARSFIPGGPIDLTLRSLPGAGPFSLSSWQDHMAEIHRPDSDVVSIEATTVDCAAQALITYCIWIHCVRQPPAVKLKEVLQEQFPSPRPTISGPFTNVALFAARVKIGPGFGKGPRAEVLGRAVEILISDELYWTDCGEYKTLRLHPSLSPIPRRFISHESLGTIKGFHSTPLRDRLYESQDSECTEYQFLVNIPGMDPSLISRSRSQEEHDGVCASIISFITLGSVDIQHHPDFLALSDGFNVALEPFAAYDTDHHILERGFFKFFKFEKGEKKREKRERIKRPMSPCPREIRNQNVLQRVLYQIQHLEILKSYVSTFGSLASIIDFKTYVGRGYSPTSQPIVFKIFIKLTRLPDHVDSDLTSTRLIVCQTGSLVQEIWPHRIQAPGTRHLIRFFASQQRPKYDYNKTEVIIERKHAHAVQTHLRSRPARANKRGSGGGGSSSGGDDNSVGRGVAAQDWRDVNGSAPHPVLARASASHAVVVRAMCVWLLARGPQHFAPATRHTGARSGKDERMMYPVRTLPSGSGSRYRCAPACLRTAALHAGGARSGAAHSSHAAAVRATGVHPLRACAPPPSLQTAVTGDTYGTCWTASGWYMRYRARLAPRSSRKSSVRHESVPRAVFAADSCAWAIDGPNAFRGASQTLCKYETGDSIPTRPSGNDELHTCIIITDRPITENRGPRTKKRIIENIYVHPIWL